ncbi:MAG: hypothetical protein AAFR13_02115 [Pseudomonadota bacterium]
MANTVDTSNDDFANVVPFPGLHAERKYFERNFLAAFRARLRETADLIDVKTVSAPSRPDLPCGSVSPLV